MENRKKIASTSAAAFHLLIRYSAWIEASRVRTINSLVPERVTTFNGHRPLWCRVPVTPNLRILLLRVFAANAAKQSFRLCCNRPLPRSPVPSTVNQLYFLHVCLFPLDAVTKSRVINGTSRRIPSRMNSAKIQASPKSSCLVAYPSAKNPINL